MIPKRVVSKTGGLSLGCLNNITSTIRYTIKIEKMKRQQLLILTAVVTVFTQAVFFAQSPTNVNNASPVKSYTLPDGMVLSTVSYADNVNAKTLSTSGMMTANCPVPVWGGTKVLNCNKDSSIIFVLDSAQLLPSGGYMSPGFRFEISGLDGFQCSQNRLEIWMDGKLTTVVGPTSDSCSSGCNYWTWNQFFGSYCGNGAMASVYTQYMAPSRTVEIRVYDSGHNGNFNWKMVDLATANLAGSGTWNFSSIGSGYGTTGVFSKANGVSQGTATFTCSTCTAGSLKDLKNGMAYFYPAKTLPGKYGITYTFDNGIGCTNSNTDTITTSANSGWTAPDSVCVNGTYDLNVYLKGTATLGGTWSGTDVTGSNFNPIAAGLVNVTYTIAKGSTCETNETHSIKVVKSTDNYNASWQVLSPLCMGSNNTYNLNDLLSNNATAGGTWSGSFVTGSTLNAPNYPGTEYVTLTYTLGAGTFCEVKETHTVELTDGVNAANWNSPDTVCLFGTYDLKNYLASTASPNGVWSGKNVSGNNFSPVDSGYYSIIYTANKGASCEKSVTHLIFVRGIKSSVNASWTAPLAVCVGTTYNLNSFLTANSTSGGTWSGTGVSGSNFLSATSGQFPITYTVSSGAKCSSAITHTISVNSTMDAGWTSPDTVCVGSAFNLNDYLSGSATLGGTWSGTGVSADNFYPGIPGNYNITYTVAKGTSCEISQAHSIHVIVDKINNATWNTPVWVCSGTTYDLNTYLTAASTKGGTWSGTGVTGNNFMANTAGAFSITYSVTGSHCVQKVVQTINVLVDSTKNANWSIPVDTSCTYNLNNYLDPMATWGGQWSGQNVFGDYFIPNGPGTYNVTYTLAPGTLCEAKVTKSININFAAEKITRLTDSCKLVWPGDADRDLIANNKDILSIGVAYGSTGPIRDSISTDTLGYVWALQQVNTNWVGQWAKSWGVKLSNGIDYKNVDCNGDGTIDVNDTIAVIKNYGRTHNFKEAEPVYINGLPDLTFNFPMDTVNTGAGLSVPIILGTSFSPVNGVYGAAFTVSYDPTIIDTSEIGVSLNGSWLGTSGTNLISITRNFSSYGQMDIAIVRTNHQDVSGYGKIAELNLRLKDDMSGQPSGTVYKKLILETSKLRSINATEVIVPLNIGKDSVIIKNTGPLGIKQHVRSGSVKVYPNPASGIINIDISMAEVQTIQLVNILGETVKLINNNIGNRTTIDTQSLPAGIYYLSVVSSQERIVRPVHIIK